MDAERHRAMKTYPCEPGQMVIEGVIGKYWHMTDRDSGEQMEGYPFMVMGDSLTLRSEGMRSEEIPFKEGDEVVILLTVTTKKQQLKIRSWECLEVNGRSLSTNKKAATATA